jgi:hypothetical protein
MELGPSLSPLLEKRHPHSVTTSTNTPSTRFIGELRYGGGEVHARSMLISPPEAAIDQSRLSAE